MSDAIRVALVGATGLIGREVIRACVGREDIRLAAVARREMPLPKGARMELFAADPENWSEVFEALRPSVLICALGTTWKQAGEDEAAFRAVDEHLVLATARGAHAQGVSRMVVVSSVGADPYAKNFYLRVKGEVERELGKIGFQRLDILRPGLLRGQRDGDRRPAERLGIALSPLMNALLHGKYRRYRAIDAGEVARAALALARKPTRARLIHEHDALRREARGLPMPEAGED
ncbi:nucleoside-diphosphate sugar epimerase [Erythrobacter sp. QSSC1-22B]|uniref:NAD(P)H-binding protein n=1 Tax=Erythrobacter sp. QSSC1-22B TaxID=1860125 RepID=UPI00080515DD|nr:NAD(P)H-binding protein [Erythrobacter sp. QSSC1-22B]OBX20423.1 nucleoside-diphosphate sugar epimerase [Erythrobacter sp. QSSC1-22B]